MELMMNRVYIDNNVWDFAYKNNVDLITYFPKDKFTLAISKLGRFEITQMPDNLYTVGLKEYMFSSLVSDIEEVHTFGFIDPRYTDDEQRSSGFGVGYFSSNIENNERERLNSLFGGQGKRKSTLILNKQEADIELGALSVRNYVLTLDKKSGPLKSVSQNGGKVIFLNELSSLLEPSVLQIAADQISRECKYQFEHINKIV